LGPSFQNDLTCFNKVIRIKERRQSPANDAAYISIASEEPRYCAPAFEFSIASLLDVNEFGRISGLDFAAQELQGKILIGIVRHECHRQPAERLRGPSITAVTVMQRLAGRARAVRL
jgi:hypothetical protein